ncbi:MAG: DUF6049 family protein [Kibdelosporangium sp.]
MSGLRFATRRKFVLAAAAAGVLIGSTGLSAPLARAQPPLDPLVAPLGIMRTQPAAGQPRIRLDIDQLNPRVVRADTGSLTLTGKVTNIGDRRVDELEIRLQRGEALTTEAKLRDAMTKPASAGTEKTDFVPVSKSIEQNATADFSITVPVDDLKLDQPGVYPVLINVNGRPANGNTERLTEVNMLLPVVRGGTPPAAPSRITLLWPLVDDHPRMLQQKVDNQVVLTDDELMNSLRGGGRLFSMLNTVELAVTSNPTLASSICYAVDGDLLDTVRAMESGYLVRTQTGGTAPGQGKDYAQRWLDKLRSLTRGQCVIALPYADADLSALSRSGAADLAKNAIELGVKQVKAALAPVQPLPGVIWPIAGTLDQRALADLTGSTPTAVLTNPDRLNGITGPAPYPIGETNRAVPIDQLVSGALAGNAGSPISVQNALATLVFRTMLPGSPGQSVLVAPPRRWTAPAGEQRAFLETIVRLYSDNLAKPQVLQGLAEAPAAGAASGLNYPPEDAAAELPAGVMTEVSQSNAVQRDLLGAMLLDDTTGINPIDLIAPVRAGLLRATSGAWRPEPAGALQMSGDVRGTLNAMRAAVTVSPPGPPITLASSSSPIPIRIGNGLPVAIEVRFVISESSSLRPAQIPERRIAAGSTFTQTIPAELLRAGKFTVDVGLTTPGGTTLGTTSRVEISSTSYGTITVAVTGVAGGVLVLLATRRIWRRMKAGKTEQDPERAEADQEQEQTPA